MIKKQARAVRRARRRAAIGGVQRIYCRGVRPVSGSPEHNFATSSVGSHRSHARALCIVPCMRGRIGEHSSSVHTFAAIPAVWTHWVPRGLRVRPPSRTTVKRRLFVLSIDAITGVVCGAQLIKRFGARGHREFRLQHREIIFDFTYRTAHAVDVGIDAGDQKSCSFVL